MVTGNPYTFSIMADIVDEWNIDRSFNNGLLFMGINGVLIPGKITTATLNTELPCLIEKLRNPMINNDIFQMEKNDAFIYIYKQVFPDNYDMENNYNYDITPYEFADNDYLVFMVSNGRQSRVLASELQYMAEKSAYNLEKLNVIDTYVTNEELEKITRELSGFWIKICKS